MGGSLNVLRILLPNWPVIDRGSRGGMACRRYRRAGPIYSAIAIQTGLALRLVFHQPLR